MSRFYSLEMSILCFTRSQLYAFINEHSRDYIVRAVGDGGLIVDGVEQSLKSVVRLVQRKVVVQSETKAFLCGIKRS